jgi:hypothetical protein
MCDLNPLIKNLERQLAQVVHKQEKSLEQVQAAQSLIHRMQVGHGVEHLCQEDVKIHSTDLQILEPHYDISTEIQSSLWK